MERATVRDGCATVARRVREFAFWVRWGHVLDRSRGARPIFGPIWAVRDLVFKKIWAPFSKNGARNGARRLRDGCAKVMGKPVDCRVCSVVATL